MGPKPVVTGLSPKEGPPGTKVTIRGEFLGSKANDLIALTICGIDCYLSAEWKSPNKIVARTGPSKGKGDVIVTTLSGGVGSSTLRFRAYFETIGPMKESAVWTEESPMQSLAWGRRTLAPSGYTQDDPLGLSNEENDKKYPEDLRDVFPDSCGDLSQENFSPGWFLLENHHGTSFEDLKAGLSFLRRKVESQKEGQLSFLKSNAGSVIDQLDTLMVLKDNFQEDFNQSKNPPMKELEKSIQKSMNESHNLFNDVLLRREKADSIRTALAALTRNKFLFTLPNSIERTSKREEYDIIINDYSRAKNLFGKTDIALFQRVLDEVNNRIIDIRKELHKKILFMPQSVEQQKKYVKALINLELQQMGIEFGSASNPEHIDPAWAAIDRRAEYLIETFKKTFEEFTQKDSPQNVYTKGGKDQTPVRVLFCDELAEIAASQFPELWRLGQSYFAGELRGINDPKPGNFKKIILNAIEECCQYLRCAVLPYSKTGAITWPNNSGSAIHQYLPWMSSCLRYVRVMYGTLIRLDLPNEALDIVLKLIDEIRLHCLSTNLKKTCDKVKKLRDKEEWLTNVSDFPGATLLPCLLEKILVENLEEGQQNYLTVELREGPLLENNDEAQREITQRVQEILEMFCHVIESLGTQRCEDDSPTPTISQLIGFPNFSSKQNNSIVDNKYSYGIFSWEQRVLCCLANCIYCSKTFFDKIGDLFVKHGYPKPTTAIRTAKVEVNKVFDGLLAAYVEQKSDPLVGTIEPSMYIGRFQWDLVDKVGHLRPYAHECLNNLIGVYSEIFMISPYLVKPVLEPIVQMVAEELARLMSCVQKISVNGRIQANVDIRLTQFALQKFCNGTANLFFTEALDAIKQLSPDDKLRADKILEKTKTDMKLELMSLVN